MTADEFSKIVRGGSDKLRVDNIVLTFGGNEFHGSGTMLIEQDKIKLVVQVWKLARELFKEENLSEQEPRVGAGSQLFIRAKNDPTKQFDKRIIDECEGHRMFKRIHDTEPFSTRKKFQAVLNHFQFDQHWRTEIERAFSTWESVRNELFHLKERTTLTEDDQRKDLTDQRQIAGAVNILVLKVIEHSV